MAMHTVFATSFTWGGLRGSKNLRHFGIICGGRKAMGILEELRWTAMKLVNVGKFSVDSAVSESFKGGKQVYANVKEKLKGLPISPHSDGNKKQNYVAVEEMQATLEKMDEDVSNIKRSDGNKKQNYVAVEEKQAKLEKMQEDKNDIKQQNEIIHRTKQLEHVKHFPNDPLKSSVPEGISAYQPPAQGIQESDTSEHTD